MSLWRQVVFGLRSLRNRAGAARDIDDEVCHWLEEEARALEAEGVEPAEARRLAAGRGRATAVREEVGSYGWENVLAAVGTDARLAGRRLRRTPGFTAVAVLTLGLGIGGATAIFSAVRPVLLSPLPYPDAGSLVAVSDRGPDGAEVPVAFGTYVEIAARSRSFEAMAVTRPWRPTLTGAGAPERLAGQRVSAAYFSVLGVAPALGRGFDASEDRPEGPRVAILSDGLWRARFGADSALIGGAIRLDGQPFTVIGVMPRGFENVVAPAARVWTPLGYDASLQSFDRREWGHHLRMVGRLRPGVPPEAARAELSRIAASPVREAPRPPWASLENGLLVTLLGDAVTRSARPAVLAIAGSVFLLLLISCVNVANLLLARSAARGDEFSMRAALGAGRGRLMRQVVVESLVLAGLAAAVGMAAAAAGVEVLVALAPPDLPRLDAIALDTPALGAGLLLALLVGTAVGMVPALGVGRGGGRVVRGGGGRVVRARSILVVAEVALTLVLLVGAGLLLRSLDRLFAVDPGIQPGNVVALQVQASGPRFDDDASHRFFEAARAAVAALPAVENAAVASQLPLTGQTDLYGVHRPGGAIAAPTVDRESGLSAERYAVTPDYLDALGIPLVAGRWLEPSDATGGSRAIVISESLARRAFPGRDPVGERMQLGRTDLPPYTVVGVVGDVLQLSLSGEEGRAVYLPPRQWYFADAARWLLVRTDGDPAAMVPALRSAIWSVDPDVPIVRVATMRELVRASAAERRFVLLVFQAFAGAALLLAILGIYGVLAGDVTERLREFGIRAALGAESGRLVRLVLRRGLALAAIGAIPGIAGAVALSRGLESLLFGISRLDPVTYLAVAALLAAAATAASALPAWRAARIEPATALRGE